LSGILLVEESTREVRGGMKGFRTSRTGRVNVENAGTPVARTRISGGPRRGMVLACVAVALVTVAVLIPGCSFFRDDESTTTSTAAVSTTTAPGASSTTVGQTTTTDRFPAKVAAQGLAYRTDSSGEVSGSVTDFTVEIDRQPEKKVAVGVREGEVSGTGDMWRAAAWTAPLVATDILNLDLADYAIDYEVSGRIDGPSAGALMTIATIAALMGDQLDSKVTMTGTINPDYTIGPVGGIPQKLEGAAAAGKKTVLVPLGERYDYDIKNNEMVDLVERGAQLGLTVKEVADVFEAYPYFTGREIPRSGATGTGTPAISAAAEQKLKECIENNASEALGALDAFAQESQEAQDANSDYASASQDALSKADNYLLQGSMGASYGQSQLAMTYAFQAQLRALAYGYEDWQDLALRLKGISPETDISNFATKLVATSPTTIGEASCIMDAWAMLTSARVAAEDGTWALDQISNNFSDLTQDELGSYMGEAINKYVYAQISLWAAEDDLKLAEVAKGPAVTSPERVKQMSEAYRRAAEANLAMLDSTVIPQKAEEWGVSEQDAKLYMLMQDSYYFQGTAASGQVQTLLDELPDGTARDYAVLGASFMAFTSSAASMATNYNYGAQYDADGNVTGFVYDKPLSRALDLARTNAEGSLLQIDSSSGATVVPWVWYEFANVDREGAAADKINALFNYWNAHVQARTLQAISGGLEPLVD
jgi:uncharacterized protein